MKLFSKNDQTSGGADWLIVGLGNPGPKYEMTRHNAGFLMLDAIAEHFNIEVRRVKFKGLYGKGTIAGQSAVLLKPSTFMNLSGQSVTEAMSFFHIPPERTLIVFDDISLDVGRTRIRLKGSAGAQTEATYSSSPSSSSMPQAQRSPPCLRRQSALCSLCCSSKNAACRSPLPNKISV